MLGLLDDRDEIFEQDIDPVIARVNEQHAVVVNGGQTSIAFFDPDGTFALGKLADLNIKYANDRVAVPGSKQWEPISAKWVRSKDRREYSNIVFKPGGIAPPKALNMWTGWGVEPDSEASCDLILAHIHEVMCDGNKAYSRYVLG